MNLAVDVPNGKMVKTATQTEVIKFKTEICFALRDLKKLLTGVRIVQGRIFVGNLEAYKLIIAFKALGFSCFIQFKNYCNAKTANVIKFLYSCELIMT